MSDTQNLNVSNNSSSNLTETLEEFKCVSRFRGRSLVTPIPKALKRTLEDKTDTPCAKLPGSPLMSPWEFRRLRSDLVEAKAHIVRLEERIDQLHRNNKEAVILFDKEKVEMKTQLDANRRTVKDLENRLQCVRTREAELKEELLELKEARNAELLRKDERISELRIENTTLRSKMQELKHAAEWEQSGSQEVEELRAQLRRARLDIEEQMALYDDLSAKFTVVIEESRDFEKLQLELQLAKEKVKELESQKSDWQASLSLQQRFHRTEQLEAEVRSQQTKITELRATIRQQLLQEEQLASLKKELDARWNQDRVIEELREKNQLMELELNAWKEVGSCPRVVKGCLSRAQEAEVAAIVEKGQLKAMIDEVLRQREALEMNLGIAKKEKEECQNSFNKLQSEAQMLRRKVALLVRERDSYRQQLDFYESDLTVSGNEGAAGQEVRIKELEDILSKYRKQLDALEEQVREVHQDSDDREKRLAVEMEVVKLRAECQALSRRNDELEELLERHCTETDDLKILHIKNNPFAVAEAALLEETNSLRAECEALKARVRLLEAGEQLDLTVKVKEDVFTGHLNRIKELEEQLESAQLKTTRLKEVFRRTSQDFRDVSYMLLGYRIDLVNNKLYRLTNMYSDHPDDHLMFQQNKDGMMEMLETSFASTLPHLVEKHLLKGNSIPCFLSAITLHLQTSAAADSEVEKMTTSDHDDEEVEEEEEASMNENETTARESEKKEKDVDEEAETIREAQEEPAEAEEEDIAKIDEELMEEEIEEDLEGEESAADEDDDDDEEEDDDEDEEEDDDIEAGEEEVNEQSD